MITLVLPVYNVEEYLDKCLSTIFNQTFKDFELIIVNDGATDNSDKIIKSYINKFSNIIYLEQKNQGQSVARNNAIKKASGEYIIFIDSDDFLDLTMLEKMYNLAITNESDAVICGHKELYEKSKRIVDVKLPIIPSKIYDGIEVANLMLECKIMGVTWNKLLKTELVKKTPIYFEPGRYTQDWYPMFKIISNCKKISFVNETLYTYIIRDGSTTSKKDLKRILDYSHAVSQIKAYVSKNIDNYNPTSYLVFKMKTFLSVIQLCQKINKNPKQLIRDLQKKGLFANDFYIRDIFLIKKLTIRTKLRLIYFKLFLT